MMQMLTGFFTVQCLVGFMLGSVATIALYRVGDHVADRRDPSNAPHRTRFRSTWLAWGLVFIVTGYIGVQQQQTATDVRALADNTNECSRQFNSALKARAAINDDSDRLAKVQREALVDWLHDIISPPADVQQIRDSDPDFGQNPRYVQWSIDVTTRYYNIIQRAQAQQDANDTERAKHTYPEPSCGK